MSARFYDHCVNQIRPAVAEAMARIRREAIASGNAYRVEANLPDRDRFYWDGGRYDALALAKELFRNRYENVILTAPDGRIVDIDNARF
jgi:hypothetical protein